MPCSARCSSAAASCCSLWRLAKCPAAGTRWPPPRRNAFTSTVRPLVTCLLGLIVYHWLDILHRGPSLLPDRQDQTFPYALATFAPSGVRGVILAGFFAAVMSTVSALANSVATIFSLDVYRRFWRANASDDELITTGRIAAGAALVLAALTAPTVARIGLFKYFQTGVTYMD